MRAIRASYRIAAEKPKTRLSPISPSPPEPGKSKPARPAARIESQNTISFCGLKRSLGPERVIPGARRSVNERSGGNERAPPGAYDPRWVGLPGGYRG